MSSQPQPASPATSPAPPPEALPLRVVLFGLPAAGKSSLLGALAQAADEQPALLKGTLADKSQKLGELRQRVYFTNQPTRTVEEVVGYPVEYRPTPPPGEQAEPVPALLIDCDGQAAIDLLRRRQQLNELTSERALARAVLDADALVLVIDASAPVKQMETDFEEFSQFLTQMEASRGARTDVGGLPVFLALTKCDLLGRPDLPRAQWLKLIEERQRYVGERFKSFIRRRRSEQERRTFGRIDLYQAATATHQPAFADAGARPTEPFGVGPLFAQAFEKAAVYRTRRRAARRRLVWTIGLAGVVLGVLLTMLAYLLLLAPVPFTPDTRTPEQRLAGTPDQLRSRLKDLEKLQADDAFAKLPPGRQREVEFQIQELKDYLAYFQQVYDVGWPGVIESEERLRQARDKLATEFAPRAEWAKTNAARERANNLRDAELLLEKADEARKWYRDTANRLLDLWALRGFGSPVDWPLFKERSDRELARLPNPSFDEKRPLREGQDELTWGNVLRIDTVKRASDEAHDYQRKLTQVRHVAAALGLLALGREYPDALKVPAEATLDQAAERAALLKTHYPRHADEIKVTELPEAMLPEVARAAEASYRALLKVGRGEVLRQLRKSGGDTRPGWLAVRAWLQAPKELAEWHTVVRAVNALRVPPPDDPVRELADFLAWDPVPLAFEEVEVGLPLGLELAPKTGAALQIVHGGGTVSLPLDATRRDTSANLLRATFLARSTTIQFRPGNDLSATLKLADDRALAWKGGERSAQYKFERLALPPRLGDREEYGVKLRVLKPDGGLPTVPDLLPQVTP